MAPRDRFVYWGLSPDRMLNVLGRYSVIVPYGGSVLFFRGCSQRSCAELRVNTSFDCCPSFFLEAGWVLVCRRRQRLALAEGG